MGTGGRIHHPFFNTQANSIVRNHDTFGVLKVRLRGARYAWRFVPIAGQTFTDAGSGRCH